ncbi:MAG: gamma-glutamylcyclotransferase, partial [Proteobacteria bacterium]|nr:gamma-glutamylcyclotransferase [Pseudomonadota bacterium]
MTEPADILLFSYGTLRLASVQLASFGRLLDG